MPIEVGPKTIAQWKRALAARHAERKRKKIPRKARASATVNKTPGGGKKGRGRGRRTNKAPARKGRRR